MLDELYIYIYINTDPNEVSLTFNIVFYYIYIYMFNVIQFFDIIPDFYLFKFIFSTEEIYSKKENEGKGIEKINIVKIMNIY